jgi:hypothetical protein
VRIVAVATGVAALVIAAAGSAGAAGERDARIRPSVGIGKVRLGMTLAQVRRVLGPPQLLNRRVKVGFGGEHRECVWNWFEWTVAFRGTAGRFRAVRVVTSLQRHRYRGVGVGSRVRTVARVFPRATCRVVHAGGTHITVLTAGGRELRFVVPFGPISGPTPHPRPLHIGEVIVQDPLGPHGFPLRIHSALPPHRTFLNPSSPCTPGWQRR